MEENKTLPTILSLNVPDIGDYDKLELISWLKKPDEEFFCGDEICELVSDKAVFPLEAEKNGKLIHINVKAPCNVKIGQKLGEYLYY